jgi:large subunit ribosomal protein L3
MSTGKRYPEGLLGKKLGMTQVFTDDGACVPVTALQVGPCYVLQVKNLESDGYSAVQLGFEPKKTQRVGNAMTNHFAKAGKGCFYHIREVRCDAQGLGWAELGKELNASDVFQGGEFVDVSGVSIGRGFSGVFRRHGMKGQPMTRGTHEVRRHVGSIGCRKFPGRVWKNQRMPGQHGNKSVTVQNLKIMDVRPEENIVLVKGAIPGPQGELVFIRKAIKKLGMTATKAA